MAESADAPFLVRRLFPFLLLLQYLRRLVVHEVSPPRVPGPGLGGCTDRPRSLRTIQDVGQRDQSGAAEMGGVNHHGGYYIKSRAALPQKTRFIQFRRQ